MCLPFPVQGPTPTEVLSQIEDHWNEVLKRLRVSPSKKGTTIEEKISYVLQKLKKNPSVQDAEHQLATVVCEVISQECRKEVLQIIKEVEQKVRVLCVHKGCVGAGHFGRVDHEFVMECISNIIHIIRLIGAQLSCYIHV